ncbi:tail connector protein [Aeromonas phage 32]|nr:tail connector protein [Aeromonas phage 32]
MNKTQEAAPLLRPLITTQGLQAAVEASTLGKAVKIVQVGLTATPGEATAADTSLPGAVIVPVADGRLVNDHQVNVSALLPDTFPSMGIAGIAFYLEDGTMFAVYREPEPFLDHTGGTTLLVGMDLVMDNIPSESVIVESTGANLILGDWVPVERTVNGKALTKDIALNAADVGAVNLNGDTMKGRLWFVDDQKAIEPVGNNLQITANLGKVVLKGQKGPTAVVAGVEHEIIHTGNLPKTDLSGYVPTTRKVNNKALDKDISLTAADVDAVGKTGPQTMAGQLNGVKFTVTDAYGLVSRLRPQHGVYLGNNANDKRTIIGGGGDAVGDATGAIHFRPNGITDADGEVIIQPTGHIDSPVAPTAGKHLTNKTYVDKVASDVGGVFKKYLPLLGGTLTGAVIGAIMKGAIKLKDKASISFQDDSGPVLHAFAISNALRFAHGNNGENRIMDVSTASIVGTVPIYANTGVIARNADSSKWLAMEIPATGNPYLSAQAVGEATATQAMVFGKDVIDFMKTPRANSATIRHDAGLRFSPNDDMSGTTWGIGTNPNDRTLSIHKYVDGAWTSLPFWIDAPGTVGMNSLKVKGGADVEYMQVRNAGNPTVELHEPGKHAVMMYKPQGTATVRFCSSNGAGGEAVAYGGVDVDGYYTASGRFRAIYQAANRSWAAVGSTPFYAEGISVGDGSFRSIVGGYSVLPGQWSLESNYGTYCTTNPDTTAHVLQMTDGGGFNRIWQFRNNGEMASPNGSGLDSTGIPYGPAFAAYGNMANWATANFALSGHVHDASQGNASMVQGRHSEVGTYMFAALHVNAGGPYNPGQQVPGSLLYPAACGERSQNRAWTFPGTWMCCGYVDPNSDDRYDDRSTLWFRVA